MISLEKKDMIDLTKQVQISLQKTGLTSVIANLVLMLDVSGSMENLYRNGTVQNAAERVLALSTQIDADQSVDVFVFDSGVKHIGTLDLNDRDGWVNNNIYKKGLVGGGTNYGPAIKAVTNKFGNKKGFMGLSVKPNDLPTYVLFVTDGENNDHQDATKAIVDAANHGIFWQFVGIGNASFNFLKTLDTMPGRKLDNANFFQLDGEVDDTQLYDNMLAEFPGWIPQARALGLLN